MMAQPPANMSEVCRLCSTPEGKKQPIFEDSHGQDPLSYRILVCVNVEVTNNDVLSTLICESCLNHVNNWFQFKQLCDLAQEKQSKWLDQLSTEAEAVAEGELSVKTEPIDDEVITEEEEQCYLEIKEEDVALSEEEGVCETLSIQVATDDPLCLSSLVQQQPRIVKPERANRENVENIDPEVITDISACPGSSTNNKSADLTPIDLSLLKRRRKRTASVVMSNNKCLICKKEFSNKNSLRRHKLTHTEHKYVCKLCQQAYLSSSSLYRHMQAHKGVAPFKCSPCRIEFADQAEFDEHRLMCTLVSPIKFKPVTVKRVRQGWNSKDIPLKVTGKSVKEVELPLKKKRVKNFECTICNKSLGNRLKLKFHLKMHQTTCRYCKRDFKSRAGYQNHMKTHATKIMNGKKIKRYLCKFCPKVQTKWHLAVKHKQSHLNDMPKLKPKEELILKKKAFKPYNCQECSETFNYWKTYIKHKQTHLTNTVGKSRQYTCGECNESFNGWYSLVRHRDLHKTDRNPIKSTATVASRNAASRQVPPPRLLVKKKIIINPVALSRKSNFTCNICDREFKNTPCLERHMSTHSKAKNFSCHICGNRMKYATSVQQHLKSVHNISYAYGLIKPDVAVSEDVSMPTLKKEKGVVAQRTTSVTPVHAHTCPVCSKRFVSKALMTSHHQIIHKGANAFRCKHCPQMYLHQSTLLRHELTHLKSEDVKPLLAAPSLPVPELLTCAGCPLTFDNTQAREIHQRKENHNLMDIKIKIYSCTLCQNSYITEMALHSHRFKKHGMSTPLLSPDTTHSCYICHKSFKNHVAMRRHLRNTHLKVEREAEPVSNGPSTSKASNKNSCDICNKSFGDASSMKSHRGWHFRTNYTSPDVCLKTKIVKEVVVIEKANDIHDLDVNTCTICDKSFQSTKAFKIHTTWHIKRKEFEKPDPFKCNTCFKSFVTSKALNIHAVWHARKEKVEYNIPTLLNQNNPNTCDVCDKEFLTTKACKIHAAWHNRTPGSKLFTATTVKKELAKTYVPAELPDHKPTLLTMTKQPNPGPRKIKEKYGRPNLKSKSKAKNTSKINGKNSRELKNTCTICSLSFPTFSALSSHTGWHNRNNGQYTQQIRECMYCHKKFGSESNFHRHTKICQKTMDLEVPATKVLQKIKKKSLKHNSSNSFQTSSSSNTSKLLKSTLSCDNCPRQFTTQRAVWTHQRWHTKNPTVFLKPDPVSASKETTSVGAPKKSSKMKSWQCDLCPQSFLGQKALAIHRNMHSIKKFPILTTKKAAAKLIHATSNTCNVCNKVFSGATGLSRHRQIHIREIFSPGKVVKTKRKYNKKTVKVLKSESLQTPAEVVVTDLDSSVILPS